MRSLQNNPTTVTLRREVCSRAALAPRIRRSDSS